MTTPTNSPGRGRDDRGGGHRQVLRGDQGAGRRGHERPGGDRAGTCPARTGRVRPPWCGILAALLAPGTGRARISGVDVQQDPDTVRSLIRLAGQYPRWTRGTPAGKTCHDRPALPARGPSWPRPGPGSPPGSARARSRAGTRRRRPERRDEQRTDPRGTDNHVIVLFGATGDLARRKLLPGAVHLHAAGLLPREYRVIGASPPANALTDWQFRERAEQACADLGVTKPGDPSWPSFAERLSFGAAEPGEHRGPRSGDRAGGEGDRGPPRLLFHLAVPPAAFTLGHRGARRCRPWPTSDTRVIIEKPFGTDLASARALNQAVHAVFDESQVFRID